MFLFNSFPSSFRPKKRPIVQYQHFSFEVNREGYRIGSVMFSALVNTEQLKHIQNTGFAMILKYFISSIKLGTLKVSRFKLQYTDLCILIKITFLSLLRKQHRLHECFHCYKSYKEQTTISISPPSCEKICSIVITNQGLSHVQEKYAGR